MDNWYDSNWLVVAGTAQSKNGTWSFRDPCLLTTEATSLGHWIIRAANPSAQMERLEFLEPNLAFERLMIDEGKVVLRVEFDVEARPRFAGYGDLYVVDLPVSASSCISAGKSWLASLEKFPPR